VSNVLELAIESVDGTVATLAAGEGNSVTADAPGGAKAGDVAVVTIRPERIRLIAEGDAPPRDACHAGGVVRESLYAGPVSRFVVELDDGGELMVVRQNTETSFDDAEALRGRRVTLEWAREHTRVIGTRGGDSQ
jgi:putative spermidine/putrescine transport system ATP-binding protein